MIIAAGPKAAGGVVSPGAGAAALTVPTRIRASESAFVADASGDPTKLGMT